MPESMPLFIRISATDLLEDVEGEVGESWKIEDSIELSKRLAGKGVDVIDVSCAGVSPKQKMRVPRPSRLSVGGKAYQAVSLSCSLLCPSLSTLVTTTCFSHLSHSYFELLSLLAFTALGPSNKGRSGR